MKNLKPSFLTGVYCLVLGIATIYGVIRVWPAVDSLSSVTITIVPAGQPTTSTTANGGTPTTPTAAPAQGAGEIGPAKPMPRIYLAGNWWSFQPTPEVALLLIVLLFGVLGSVLHMTTSFTSFVGRGSFGVSWRWW